VSVIGTVVAGGGQFYVEIDTVDKGSANIAGIVLDGRARAAAPAGCAARSAAGTGMYVQPMFGL